MLDLPLLYRNFVSAAVFEAEFTTIYGTQTLLIETRTYMKKMNESQNQFLFTIINDKPVHVRSIVDLILHDPQCLSLSLPHSVVIELNGVAKRALLTEVYVPHRGAETNWSIRLALTVDGKDYQTGLNDTLQDSFGELHEQMGLPDASWVKICYQCNYVHGKLNGLQDERENLQCFRDSSPEHFEEARRLMKFASAEAWGSGDFFVTAFHTCAAWKRWQPPMQATS